MDKCKLFCRAARYNFFFQMNDKVIDGTRCDDESEDVCINGKCQVGVLSHNATAFTNTQWSKSSSTSLLDISFEMNMRGDTTVQPMYNFSVFLTNKCAINLDSMIA